ncbi:MAG: hypothetical protein HQ503_05235, partial [Rhodospirillales bacterium]|nr:hypothetical protein [Rhodospirillales bacterium]
SSIMRIYGTKGILEARDNFTELTLFPADAEKPKTTEKFSVDHTLSRELTAFADACAGKAEHPVRPEEALRNVAVMESIVASSDQGGAWIELGD